MANETGLDFSDQIISLENKYQQALKDLYTHLTPIQRVNIARHPNRPTFLDHVFNITEKFVELHGDRAGYDDPAVVTGLDHHGFPIITFIDTPGAYADLKSEELGQGEAIAQNLRTMFGLKVPIVSIVMGEGGSGGALAIGCANKLLMLEMQSSMLQALKHVPQSCGRVRKLPQRWFKDVGSPKELTKLQIADGVIPVVDIFVNAILIYLAPSQEPLGGAHADPYWTSQQIKTAILESMDELVKMDTETLLKHRAQKFRKLGGFQEGVPIDPKRKVNMKKKDKPIVPISKNSESELRDEVEKLKTQILEASKSSAEHPRTGLKEMIEKLKREIDYEYDEAAKALGMQDKILMLREEVAKARNHNDQLAHPALKEKIDHLKDEFDKNLPSAPNYPNLKYKLGMLKELSKASNLTKKSTTRDELKLEINKRFGEFMDRPDVKQKIEMLKAEIASSGVSNIDSKPELKEKVSQMSGELESEFKAVLNSMGLQVVPSYSEALAKINAFDEEVNMTIDDLVNSSYLKERIELLKTEVEKAGNTPDEDSKSKIQALQAEIKQAITEAISFPELKKSMKGWQQRY
ncbi:UNVERIFIED_CONTAM: Acetyl-coenzyme A carboxylase carboxyl transferase subunit alpha, chloroplastic [Sesamum angustifolium]|uniref:acetyl-CoA carboxytransferase n=1 Tax=Sesamum angustifolium TaxID=2727405 RepID=A0AAW2MNL4_9LAMI